jgi:hypothetical protein
MVIHIYASPYIPNSRLEWDLVLELGGRYREGQSTVHQTTVPTPGTVSLGQVRIFAIGILE